MTPTEQAADRVKALVEEHRSLEQRFQGYHNTEVSWDRPSAWGDRAAQERQTADDLTTLLSALTALQARVGELEGALKPLLSCLDDIETYQRRPERGSYDAECACCMGEMFEPEEYAAMEKARALLTPPLEQE